MRKRLTVLGLALLLVFAGGCDKLVKKAEEVRAQAGSNKKETIQDAPEEIVIPIQAMLPFRGSISSHFETTTRVEAEVRVQVTAEAIGECLKINVQEGDRVKTGDVLAELDKKSIEATIGQTEVQVRQTKTALDIAERSLAEGIGAKAERDNARFAHEQAVATLNMQQVQLTKLTIRAPIDGIVTKRNIQEGQIVATGVPVFTIVDPASFMLVINPPEKELARVKIGQVAKVTIDALGDQEFEAKVRRINPAVDSATGTVKVILDVDPEIRSRLREAAFARVGLIMETHENALLVPKDALVEENARKYLFVVEREKKEADTAEAEPKAETESAAKEEIPADSQKEGEPGLVANRVEITAGLEDSNDVEILTGIDDKSLIVTLGQHTLKSGSRVKVTNATDELLSKAGMSVEESLKAAQKKREGMKQVFAPEGRRHRP